MIPYGNCECLPRVTSWLGLLDVVCFKASFLSLIIIVGKGLLGILENLRGCPIDLVVGLEGLIEKGNLSIGGVSRLPYISPLLCVCVCV